MMKRRTIIFVFSMIITLNNWAQVNLVPNYSFEDYSTCPNNTGQIFYMAPWFQPNLAGESSDAYHQCNYPSLPNVPNSIGYQYPRTGNGLAGINLYHDTASFWRDYDREYIEVELNNFLIQDKKYCVSYYVNKANRSGFALKQIQAVLTNDSLLYYDANWAYITGVTPIAESDSYVSDTLGWTRISEIIIANGGEKFLTIGNFEQGTNVDYQMGWWPYNAPDNTLGYYFFDDISVYELPDYNAGADTTICPWDTILIGPQNIRGDVQYSWSPITGLDDPTIANPMASPLTQTTYVLTVVDTNQWACNSILRDTITIYVQGCLGVDEINYNENIFEFYPNPATMNCVYEAELETDQTGEVEIYNITGSWMQTLKLTEGFNRLEIDLTPFENGVYVFKIRVNGELIETKRLVVTK